MERKRIIAAFGDIRGFRKWTLRALNSPEISERFIEEVYGHFEHFTQDTTSYVKYLGDGLLIIRELGNGKISKIAKQFLYEVHDLTKNIEGSIQGTWPRPDGFRVRVACGYVWKRQTRKRYDGRNFRHPEYIGYAVNMAQALLYVYPETPNICHESIIELIGTKKNGMVFEQLPPPKERRHGVDPQDFNGLWSFGMVRKD